MSDEVVEQAETDLRRAKSARGVLDNRLVVAAFAAIEDELMHVMRYSSLVDVDKREEARRVLACLDLFKTKLTRHMETGHLAAATLHEIAETERLKAEGGELH